jgi:hypothetical protein
MKPRNVPRLRRFPWITGGMLLLVIGAYARSAFRSDVVAFFTPSGRLQAAGLDQGRVYFFLSNLPFGPERTLTVDHVGCTHEDFQNLLGQVEAPLPPPWERWGLRHGHADAGTMDPADAWYQYASGPGWILLPLAAIPFALRLRRLLIRRRRWKRGLCIECGYDLRESTGRCPECGVEPVEPWEKRKRRAGDAPSASPATQSPVA